MARSPLPNAAIAATSPAPSENSPDSWTVPNAEEVFRTLRDAVADPASDSMVVFGAIAEAAHALADGCAAALAMRRDGVVRCVGRSGDTAPDLGVRLSVDSGISGECLRTGKVLRCDDTQKDYRCDPVVCLRLGVASIAAVPLHHDQAVIGILEAFSNRPYAFAEEHMQALLQLAKMAESAYRRDAGVVAPEPVAPATLAKTSGLSAILSTVQSSAATVTSRISRPMWRYIAAGVAAALLLFSFIAWRSTTTERAAKPSQVSTQVPAPLPATATTTGANLTWNAEVPRPTKPSPSIGGIQQAAKIEKDETPESVTRRSASTIQEQDLQTVTQSRSPDAELAESGPPQMIASNTSASPLRGVLSAEPALPRFTTPVSQGVTDGILTRKVMPIYPEQALPLRLSGTVVLEATISEDGRVRDLNLVRGNRTLAQAAIDAVSQWRYKPYLLNGKPVAMKTQITVEFKAPQN